MNRGLYLGVLVGVMLLCFGCGHMKHPQAEAFLKQAKGETGIETANNLIGLMEASVQQAKTETGESSGLQDLHDQFHAFGHSMCEATDAQIKTPAYDKAVTIKKEMKTVFHRLWDYKDDPTRRTLHLDLFDSRLKELRKTFQGM